MIASMDRRPSARASEGAPETTRGVPGWCWGIYLALIVAAELMISLRSVELGIGVHLLLLFAMPIHGTFVAHSSRALLTVMTLAPLIRIVNLAMPVDGLSSVSQYLLLSVPLVVALLTTMRIAGLSRREIGLRFDRLPLQVGIGLLGLPIGALIYAILQPPPPLTDPTWSGVLIAAVAFLAAIGFLEELIFRGALQTVGERTLGPWASVYVNALFAALHLGYLSPPHTGLVFLVGLIFSRLAAQGRSVVGVALAHGLTNVVVYLVFPLVIVRGGWTLPDVSWTGYSSSATVEIAAAPPSTGTVGTADLRVGVGPTPVSRQSSTAAIPEPITSTDPATPTDVSTASIPAPATSTDANDLSAISLAAAPPADAQAAAVNVAPASPEHVANRPVFVPQPPVRRVERPIFLPRPPVVQAVPAVPTTQWVRVVTARPVNVRALPGLDADVLTTVAYQTVMKIVGADQDADDLTWRHVRLDDGRSGWISSEFVEADASAPVAALQTDSGVRSDDR
jgi:membrane protease YdiL (CAAX protease family)